LDSLIDGLWTQTSVNPESPSNPLPNVTILPAKLVVHAHHALHFQTIAVGAWFDGLVAAAANEDVLKPLCD